MSIRSRFVVSGLLALLGGCGDIEGEVGAESSLPATSVSAASSATALTAVPSAPTAAPTAVTSAPFVEYESEALPDLDAAPGTIADQREQMLARMLGMGAADAAAADALREIFKKSKIMGQGNPDVTKHPMTRAQCLKKRRDANVQDVKKPACGAPFMVPIFDPKTESEADAKVCIDRFEFPNLPCEYPMTWVSTAEAMKICSTLGKRLCDAHEWEGACAGALLPADKEYAFNRPRDTMRGMHNVDREVRWAYGSTKDHSRCAMNSEKSKSCTASGFKKCGSNTYPSGAFPECASSFGVYDQHGNAAEHMLLPDKPEELATKNGKGGDPEMKGSWFIFNRHEAHPDDCRWRAPDWHDNEGKNHSNYHLGFRCCKDIP